MRKSTHTFSLVILLSRENIVVYKLLLALEEARFTLDLIHLAAWILYRSIQALCAF